MNSQATQSFFCINLDSIDESSDAVDELLIELLTENNYLHPHERITLDSPLPFVTGDDAALVVVNDRNDAASYVEPSGLWTTPYGTDRPTLARRFSDFAASLHASFTFNAALGAYLGVVHLVALHALLCGAH